MKIPKEVKIHLYLKMMLICNDIFYVLKILVYLYFVIFSILLPLFLTLFSHYFIHHFNSYFSKNKNKIILYFYTFELNSFNVKVYIYQI